MRTHNHLSLFIGFAPSAMRKIHKKLLIASILGIAVLIYIFYYYSDFRISRLIRSSVGNQKADLIAEYQDSTVARMFGRCETKNDVAYLFEPPDNLWNENIWVWSRAGNLEHRGRISGAVITKMPFVACFTRFSKAGYVLQPCFMWTSAAAPFEEDIETMFYRNY